MERASIDTAEKVVDEIKARFKAHKKKNPGTSDRGRQEKKGEKKAKGRGGTIVRRLEDRGGSYGRRASFSGSVSVTGKRSLICCSHIQVLM